MAAPEIQVCLTLLTPFAAYLAAEYGQVSGILAVAVAGLHSGMHDTRFMTIERSSVIVITLVVNGLTLPLLIRWFEIQGDDTNQREERAARSAAAHAAIAALRSRMDHQDSGREREFSMRLIEQYHRRIREVKAEENEEDQDLRLDVASERAIRLSAVAAERAELQSLRDRRRINEQVLFVIQRELDYLEAGLLAPTQERQAAWRRVAR